MNLYPTRPQNGLSIDTTPLDILVTNKAMWGCLTSGVHEKVVNFSHLKSIFIDSLRI